MHPSAGHTAHKPATPSPTSPLTLCPNAGFRGSGAAPGARPAGQQFQSALQRHVDVLMATVGEQALAALGPEFLEGLAERTMVLDDELSELYVAAQVSPGGGGRSMLRLCVHMACG